MATGTQQQSALAKLLVVDDKEIFRRLVSRTYQRPPGQSYEAEVHEAATCEDALRMLSQRTFDLIVLDLAFPSAMQGLEFLRVVKTDPRVRGIPILVVTGEAPTEEREKVLQTGAADCLFKPLDMEILRRAVRHCLAAKDVVDRSDWRRAPNRILHVEDEDEWAEIVRLWLAGKPYAFHRVGSRSEMFRFLRICSDVPPDCIVMDLSLPGADGLTICDEINESPSFQSIPLVVLTAREDKQVASLEHSAANVVVKANDIRKQDGAKLAAALKSVLNLRDLARGVVVARDLRLDPRENQVFLDGRYVCSLDQSCFAILRLLVRRSPSPVPEAEIHNTCFVRFDHRRRCPTDIPSKSVAVYMNRLRNALGPLARRIVTMRKEGYAYRVPSVEDGARHPPGRD